MSIYVIGNQEIPNFGYLPRYSFSQFDARYQFGDEFVTTARPNGYDANLKWEETTTLNVGLDFGISNGRITGSIEYYKKNNRERGPALIGIELQDRNDLKPLLVRMEDRKIRYEYVNDQPHLFHYLIWYLTCNQGFIDVIEVKSLIISA